MAPICNINMNFGPLQIGFGIFVAIVACVGAWVYWDGRKKVCEDLKAVWGWLSIEEVTKFAVKVKELLPVLVKVAQDLNDLLNVLKETQKKLRDLGLIEGEKGAGKVAGVGEGVHKGM